MSKSKIARREGSLIVVDYNAEEIAGKTVESVVKLLLSKGLPRAWAPFIYTRIKNEVGL